MHRISHPRVLQLFSRATARPPTAKPKLTLVARSAPPQKLTALCATANYITHMTYTHDTHTWHTLTRHACVSTDGTERTKYKNTLELDVAIPSCIYYKMCFVVCEHYRPAFYSLLNLTDSRSQPTVCEPHHTTQKLVSLPCQRLYIKWITRSQRWLKLLGLKQEEQRPRIYAPSSELSSARATEKGDAIFMWRWRFNSKSNKTKKRDQTHPNPICLK